MYFILIICYIVDKFEVCPPVRKNILLDQINKCQEAMFTVIL